MELLETSLAWLNMYTVRVHVCVWAYVVKLWYSEIRIIFVSFYFLIEHGRNY